MALALILKMIRQLETVNFIQKNWNFCDTYEFCSDWRKN